MVVESKDCSPRDCFLCEVGSVCVVACLALPLVSSVTWTMLTFHCTQLDLHMNLKTVLLCFVTLSSELIICEIMC